MPSHAARSVEECSAGRVRTLMICGGLSWLLYLFLLRLSSQFAWNVPASERPLLTVLILFASLFMLYVVAVKSIFIVKFATSSTDSRSCLVLVAVFAVGFRLLLLFSEPIQEIDAYRYLWDGQTAVAGVSPYRHSPQQVIQADRTQELTSGLRRLAALRDRSPATTTVISRVHYPELTTVYPPVSQAVFATVALVTPSTASVATQLLILKSAIVLFDLLTLLLVAGLLHHAGRPMEWSIVYGWCPLIVKECANSGHLDSIAVCLTTAAVLCALRVCFPAAGDRSSRGPWLWLSSVAVAAAVGAKLYAVVLFPLLFAGVWRSVSFRHAAGAAAATLVICGAVLTPMFVGFTEEPSVPVNTAADDSHDRTPPLPRETREAMPLDRMEAGNGLAAFAGRWQMNDFLFLLLFENLHPDRGAELIPYDTEAGTYGREERPPLPGERESQGPDEAPQQEVGSKRTTPWFVVTSGAWRGSVVRGVSERTGVAEESAPFLLTRLLTGTVFAGIAVWLAFRAASHRDPAGWLEAAFLTLAWFWWLLPTQNPWYWTWAVPLLPFARSRAWLAVSGVVMMYYLRFWLVAHFPDQRLPGTVWRGAEFFDFVVVWFEFAPVLVWLTVDHFRRRHQLAGDERAHA